VAVRHRRGGLGDGRDPPVDGHKIKLKHLLLSITSEYAVRLVATLAADQTGRPMKASTAGQCPRDNALGDQQTHQ
jgi:hypothetical protein